MRYASKCCSIIYFNKAGGIWEIVMEQKNVLISPFKNFNRSNTSFKDVRFDNFTEE